MPTQLAPIVGPDSPEAATSLIRIQKTRLKDQRLYCEFTEQRDEEAPPRSFALTCGEAAHPDLLRVFARLVPHFCLLTEQLRETTDGYWPESDQAPAARFAPFIVTGFSIGRNNGVTLIGQRELTGGKVLNLVSPYLAFEDENNDYAYSASLEMELAGAITEVEAALRGKCSEAGRQLNVFDQPTGQVTLSAVE